MAVLRDEVGERLEHRRAVRRVKPARLLHEVDSCVGADERIANPTHHAREADELRDGRALLQKVVVFEDGQLEVDARHELADEANLVEPVHARFFGVLPHVVARKVGRKHADESPVILALRLVADAIPYEATHGIHHLRHQHKESWVKLWDGCVGEQPRHLDAQLQSHHALRAEPRLRNLLVQLLQPGDVLLLRNLDSLVAVTELRVVELLHTLRRRRPFLLVHNDIERGGDRYGRLRRKAV
mmetsp:Transcript_30570/g.99352  ORF Transcript_30570/g.99352 Transcript_30570/m.99352 type:complete len:242 (-) Transcript_30570:132-857(-)